MSEELYPYYQRELLFIRQQAQEFAKQYPAAAGRLMLEPNRSTDPHVERLIEAFALLSGRIHRKLDDEFPELTDALLNILYPHYLAPVPSMAMVQFEVDPNRTQLNDGFRIERHSQLQTQPVRGTPCRYRTAYPVDLWPVAVTSAELLPPPFPPGLRPPAQTAAVLFLRLECQGRHRFADLTLDRLRLHLVGEGHIIGELYQLLFNHVRAVLVRSGDPAARLPELRLGPHECLHQVGFDRDEGLLPYPRRSFSGYRLLTELFTFPAKFHFVDVGGFGRIRQAGFGRSVELALCLDRDSPGIRAAVSEHTFRTGCAPAVNLFEQTAEPIRLSQTRTEYRVVPDVARQAATEVYSVDEVLGVDPVSGQTSPFQPFFSYRHGLNREEQVRFWHAARRRSEHVGDRGTEVFLNLVDLGYAPQAPADATLVVRTTCTNRDLPGNLRRLGERLELTLGGAAPVSAVHSLRAPTMPLRPPLRRGAYWRLVSHLALNHLSLADGEEGRAALQEILRLYDFSDAESGEQLAAVTRQLVDGITAISSERVVGRVGSGRAGGFARGLEVRIEFDQQNYVGTGVFLFASVLEQFLGLYTSINSFTQLIATVRQSEGILKRWPPRAGEMIVL